MCSVQLPVFRDSTYRWDDTVDVTAGETRLALTNATAVVRPAPQPAVGGAFSPEQALFAQIRRAVFRVEAGLGHGSGFLAALPGVDEALVVTNDHVSLPPHRRPPSTSIP